MNAGSASRGSAPDGAKAMATEPKRNPIKRVAMLVELEDGSTLALYAEPDPADNDAQVDVQLKQRDPELFTVDAERPEHRWVASGLHQYRMVENMPAMIGATLDAIRNAVDL